MTEELVDINTLPTSTITCASCGESYSFRSHQGRQPTYCKRCAYQRVLDNSRRFRLKKKETQPTEAVA